MGTRYVNSIIKAFTALNVLLFEDADRKGFSLSELSKRTGVPSNTLHNILRTMIYCGYAAQKEDSLYAGGIKQRQLEIIRQGDIKSSHRDLLRKLLEELQKAINEAVNLYILVNGNRIPLLMIDDSNVIRIDYKRMGKENVFKYSTGRILTAYADDYELNSILRRWGFPGENWDGINDRETLCKAREDLRAAGYCEMITPAGGTFVSAFAFPLFDSSGKMAGALGSFAPVFRCDDAKRTLIMREMRKTAELAGGIL